MTDFIDALTQLGARLWAEDGELVIRAPKGALGPDLCEKIAEQKQAILSELREQRFKPAGAQLPQIVPDPQHRHEPFPLTEIQQAYWFGRNPSFELGNVGIHVYEEVESYNLDLARLNQAWQKVIDRHDMLRAIILPDGRQRILESASYEIEVLDLRGWRPERKAAELISIREHMYHRVYSPDVWPMFRIVACRLDDDRARLFISIDALNVDMGSFAILFRDWVDYYRASDAPAPDLELSFRDYALALDAMRDSESYHRSHEYWRKRAEELPPAPDIPLAISPGSLTTQKFVRRRGELSKAAWRRLKERAARAGLTPSGTTLAVYAEVLAAWSKSLRFTINVTLFNRLPLHPQVNEIVGDFTSMVLLGVDGLEGDAFEPRARRIQKQLWHDMQYRYVSGVQVLRELARAQGKMPGQALMPCVFTSTLNLRTQGLLPLKHLGRRVYNIIQTPQVTLDLQVYEENEALVFNLDSVEGVFPDGVVDCMFDAYSDLLSRLANDERSWREPERRLVPSAQLQRRAAVNATASPLPNETLHSLFTNQAARRPQQAAVIAPGCELSYQELNNQANRIAHRLRDLGALPDTLVAVVLEKGWEQVAAVLGIIQSGAAYLAIDPRLPAERMKYLLKDGKVKLALTLSSINERLNWPEDVRRLCLDGGEFDAVDSGPLSPALKPENLAYVLYTSGSTGSPKGVMIEHRSVVNRILDVNSRFHIGPEDRVLALTALHHDLSVYDIFGVLAAGATIVMPAPESLNEPSHWARLMASEQVTVWNSVPAFMEMLVDYLEHQDERGLLLPGHLRLALMAGDWVPVTLPDRIRALMKEASVVSLGGPTETTIWDICYPVGEVDPQWKSIPYGRPMLNTSYYVLNEALEPCPDWVAGELYISGAGLARGYWGDEEKTAAAFIKHPRTGERLYRSGDLGRYLPDATIEFLGRKDSQIKIRGHRIEAAEVEEAIRLHEEVSAAVVTAYGDESRDRQLVAYVVPKRKAARAGLTDSSPPSVEVEPGYAPLRGAIHGLQQVEFKLKQKGLRYDLDNRPSVKLANGELDEAIKPTCYARRTHRDFSTEPVRLAQLSRLLSCLASINVDGLVLPKYRYPSGGSLYPVQTYVHIKEGRVDALPAGAYYYHPAERRLSLISETGPQASAHVPHNREIFISSAFSIFFIGYLEAVEPLYAELTRDFCLLEAGYMGQLLMTEAPASEIGLCPVGDIDSAKIKEILALDERYIYLHSMLGGRIAEGATTSSPLCQEPFSSSASSCSTPATSKGDDALIAGLRSLLRSKLPEYMIPSTFILRDGLPLTANGKVDRKALPAPQNRRPLPQPCELPATDLEQTIASVARQVFKIDELSISDRFFDLGANSTHLVQISIRLSKCLKREVPVIEIFKHPTIKSLARHLSNGAGDEDQSRQGIERAEARKVAIERRKRTKAR
ncbi:MAG TPA: amino acid adenylation domain-containing protein [Blastocatellia bacterium]